MKGLKQLWAKIARFADVLDGVDDPKGEYVIALGKRVDALEHTVMRLAAQQYGGPPARPEPRA